MAPLVFSKSNGEEGLCVTNKPLWRFLFGRKASSLAGEIHFTTPERRNVLTATHQDSRISLRTQNKPATNTAPDT